MNFWFSVSTSINFTNEVSFRHHYYCSVTNQKSMKKINGQNSSNCKENKKDVNAIYNCRQLSSTCMKVSILKEVLR